MAATSWAVLSNLSVFPLGARPPISLGSRPSAAVYLACKPLIAIFTADMGWVLMIWLKPSTSSGARLDPAHSIILLYSASPPSDALIDVTSLVVRAVSWAALYCRPDRYASTMSRLNPASASWS